MDNYKEIVTKAVIGKSKKNSIDKFSISAENIPNTVLGCWIINHKFNGASNGNNINVNGSYDINVWYSYDNDTKTTVAKETYNYNDSLSVHLKENSNDGKEVIVRSLKQPTVNDVKIENDKINITVEKELACEVVGNTKIKVPTQVIEDDYEDITETVVEENKVDVNEIDNVNEEYLN